MPLCSIAAPYRGPLGEFERSDDIGPPERAGQATYNAASQLYELSAGGGNPADGPDALHFAWRSMRGDFILQARVEFVGAGVDPHRQAGWMVRAGLGQDAAHVDAVVHGDGRAALRHRASRAARTVQVELAGLRGADVVQLERRGRTVLFSAARFGQPYVMQSVDAVELPDEVQVGLFLGAPRAEVEARAIFRNVRLIRPAPAGFTPYRDYIGSRLELLDVASGEREQIFASRAPFEAPNWLPDGSALIYNASGSDSATRGRLWRFDLATRTPTLIDTGFAIRNNNDHVPSFDGQWLGISDQSTGSGESTLFVLPVRGGIPRRVTPRTPSYLHGWSPDGQWLVYTGGRDGEWDIFRIRPDGSGEEENLTRSPGLDDGPEYSPDGAWIYFNSTRSGRMQLWRMRPDGASPQRVTHDEQYNDWFPHLSPDGRWIAFISYGLDVRPEDHPYYRHCYLRLMPADGSAAPRVVAYLYGGQGSINVPSWAPDSRQLAFVSNSGEL